MWRCGKGYIRIWENSLSGDGGFVYVEMGMRIWEIGQFTVLGDITYQGGVGLSESVTL